MYASCKCLFFIADDSDKEGDMAVNESGVDFARGEKVIYSSSSEDSTDEEDDEEEDESSKF